MTPGIYEGLTFEEYAAIDAISSSQLGPMKQSPLHFKVALAEEKKETDALVFGKALHCLILEPKRFPDVVMRGPDVKTRNNAAYRTFCQEYPGKIVVLPHEWKDLEGMADAIVHNTTAMELLHGSKKEVSIVWKCRETNELCKARLDSWKSELKLITDIKTTTNATRFAFQKALSDYGYHRKAAWYEWGMETLGQSTDLFAFVAVEKDEPWGVKCYTLDPNDIRLAKFENEELLKKYACCKKTNYWPCYDDCPEDLGIPEWSRRELENKYGERTDGQTNGTDSGVEERGSDSGIRADA